MANQYVRSGLVELRRDLAAKRASIQVEADRLTADIRAVDAALKVVDPTYDARDVKAKRLVRKNAFFAQHGDAGRFVLDTLREKAPLTTNQIAELAARELSLDESKADIKALRACVLTTLSRQRKNGHVVELGRDDAGSIRWALGSI